MKKLFLAYVLGILSFVLSITGIFSLFLSIPGLFLAISSLKSKQKEMTLPIGYKGKLGNKKVSAQPYISTRYLSYTAIGLNAFSIAVSVITTLFLVAFLAAGTR